MAAKLNTCPRCSKPLRDAAYHMQHCPCGWDSLPGLEDDVYQGTVCRLEPERHGIDTGAALASISISLKRIADATEEIAGWLNGNGAPLAVEHICNAIQTAIFNGLGGGRR